MQKLGLQNYNHKKDCHQVLISREEDEEELKMTASCNKTFLKWSRSEKCLLNRWNDNETT